MKYACGVRQTSWPVCLERHITQKEKMTFFDSHCFHMMHMVTMEAFNGYWNGMSLKGNASQKNIECSCWISYSSWKVFIISKYHQVSFWNWRDSKIYNDGTAGSLCILKMILSYIMFQSNTILYVVENYVASECFLVLCSFDGNHTT